jgi:hypothetical protein
MNSSTYDNVPLAMPQEALVAAIPVLILSIISLAVVIMLFLMHFYHSERWSCTLSLLAHKQASPLDINADDGCRHFFDGALSHHLNNGIHRPAVLVYHQLAV